MWHSSSSHMSVPGIRFWKEEVANFFVVMLKFFFYVEVWAKVVFHCFLPLFLSLSLTFRNISFFYLSCLSLPFLTLLISAHFFSCPFPLRFSSSSSSFFNVIVSLLSFRTFSLSLSLSLSLSVHNWIECHFPTWLCCRWMWWGRKYKER